MLDGALITAFNNSNKYRIRGIIYAMRYLMGTILPSKISSELHSISISKDTIKIQLGQFVRGLIEGCEAKLLFEEEVVNVLMHIVEEYEWKMFVSILPGMRSAFSNIGPRDYANITEQIAIHYHLKEPKKIEKVSAKLDLTTIMGEIDKKVGNILEKWL
jgi:hypothetical protein